MDVYLDLLRAILGNNVQTTDRTGTGTYTLPGYAYECKMEKDEDGLIRHFPLLTTKFVSLKSVFQELMWKLNGETNIRRLVEQDNHIWTEWPFENWLKATGQNKLIENKWKDEGKQEYSDEWKEAKGEFELRLLENEVFCEKWGELGRTYGHNFRRFGEVYFEDLDEEIREALCAGLEKIPHVVKKGKDQLMIAVERIKNNPDNRRIIITLWNPQDEEKTLLPPCPCFYQFFANEDGMLHMNMYQRSCDTFLGVPYNTAQDSLLLCLMAHVTGRKPGTFHHFFGDAHIYTNHINQVKEQLEREPHKLPSIRLNPDVKNILDFTWDDIELIGYEHEKGIKGAVSI